jgi:hypothetical protein
VTLLTGIRLRGGIIATPNPPRLPVPSIAAAVCPT